MDNNILKIADNLFLNDVEFSTRNFDGYIFKDIYFNKCRFKNIIFSNCTFVGVYWDVCTLEDTYFFNNNILSANFTLSLLRRCKFSDNSHNISFFTGIIEEGVTKIRNTINPYNNCINDIINPNLELSIPLNLLRNDNYSSNDSSDGVINREIELQSSLDITIIGNSCDDFSNI